MTTTATATTTPETISIGGTKQSYLWSWQEKQYKIVYETLGKGKPVLLLPAFSTVSTRGELRQVAQHLSSQFKIIALDWLGFGESDRPPLHYEAPLYDQLLQDFVNDVCQSSVGVLAAGHAAGYAMKLAQKQPQSFTKIVLAAPTWRGPLSTMDAPQWVASAVRGVVRSPIVGQTLYYFNTVPSFLRTMYAGHVYTDKNILTPEFLSKKRQITQKPGARYAPVAFVTGAIDPVATQPEFLSLFQPPPVPVLAVIAEEAPRVSQQEMAAIAFCSGVETARLPGALGLYEEYADELADLALEFLGTQE